MLKALIETKLTGQAVEATAPRPAAEGACRGTGTGKRAAFLLPILHQLLTFFEAQPERWLSRQPGS
jgi:hypothetical protein